jgi:hypothetical protein
MLSSKTKKYQVPVNTYVKIGLSNVLKDWWWAFLVPLAIIGIGVAIGGGWMWGLLITAVVLTILYLVFWGAQFYGLSQLPQGKVLFEKLSYEFDPKQIKIMKSQKEGMIMPWENIKKVSRSKDAYVLKLSLVQYIHLPFDIFQTENDLKHTEKLFERKGLL